MKEKTVKSRPIGRNSSRPRLRAKLGVWNLGWRGSSASKWLCNISFLNQIQRFRARRIQPLRKIWIDRSQGMYKQTRMSVWNYWKEVILIPEQKKRKIFQTPRSALSHSWIVPACLRQCVRHNCCSCRQAGNEPTWRWEVTGLSCYSGKIDIQAILNPCLSSWQHLLRNNSCRFQSGTSPSPACRAFDYPDRRVAATEEFLSTTMKQKLLV
jgi:hypothetical protein